MYDVAQLIINNVFVEDQIKYSVHSVQWGINKRFWCKRHLIYTSDDKQTGYMGTRLKIY